MPLTATHRTIGGRRLTVLQAYGRPGRAVYSFRAANSKPIFGETTATSNNREKKLLKLHGRLWPLLHHQVSPASLSTTTTVDTQRLDSSARLTASAQRARCLNSQIVTNIGNACAHERFTVSNEDYGRQNTYIPMSSTLFFSASRIYTPVSLFSLMNIRSSINSRSTSLGVWLSIHAGCSGSY